MLNIALESVEMIRSCTVAALIPCMKETDVVCANINGTDNNLLNGSNLLTASSQSLLDELVVHLYPK